MLPIRALNGPLTEPGIYRMPAAVYHADPCPTPSLSASLVKLICLSSLAHARHEHPRLGAAPREDAEHFDIGTAAHAVLLEGAAAVHVIDAPDWRTNAAKAARDAARAAGRTPLLAKVWAECEAMLAATRAQLARHRDGAAMFTDGEPEAVLVWQEGATWCRARVDWLREGAIDDYKSTSASANPDDWTRTLFYNGTDIQPAWYLRGLRALTGHSATFRFAVQETFAPYALSVIALGPGAMLLAEKKILFALEAWQRAVERDDFVGYPRKTCYASLPSAHEAWWLEKELTS